MASKLSVFSFQKITYFLTHDFNFQKVKSMQPKEFEEELKLVEKRLDRRRKKDRQSLLLTQPKYDEPQLPYTPIIERKSIIDALIESSPLVQER